MVSTLAAVAVHGLGAAGRERARLIADLHKANLALMTRNAAQQEKLAELTEVDYVAQHLRKYGVAPYLLAASDKMTRDIEEVMNLLGCERDEAIQHIRRGVLGPESAASPRHE